MYDCYLWKVLFVLFVPFQNFFWSVNCENLVYKLCITFWRCQDIQTLFILECIFGKFNCNFPLFFLTLFLSGLQIVQVTFVVLFCWSVNSMSWVSEFEAYFGDVLVLLFIERLICTIFAYPDFFLVCNLCDSGQQIMPHIPDSSIYVQCWYWRFLVVGIFRRVSFNS